MASILSGVALTALTVLLHLQMYWIKLLGKKPAATESARNEMGAANHFIRSMGVKRASLFVSRSRR